MRANNVFVYWNSHKNCWSLRDVKTRKVVQHLPSLILYSCKFKVSERGRQRVIKERKKFVHAGVEGFLWAEKFDRPEGPPFTPHFRVRYNPYETPQFVRGEAQTPINEAAFTYFRPDRRVYALS